MSNSTNTSSIVLCLHRLLALCLAGNKISTQTGIGTAIAIAGVAIYSLIKANIEEQKRVNYFILGFLFSNELLVPFEVPIFARTHMGESYILHFRRLLQFPPHRFIALDEGAKHTVDAPV